MRLLSRNHGLVLLLSLAGCGGGDDAPPAPVRPQPAALMTTLDALAAFGEKRVGTMPGQMAGEYIRDRMAAIGLSDVHAESWTIPRHTVGAASLAISIDGAAATSPGFDVFYGSGGGHAEGDLVFVGSATSTDLAGKDLTGKIALVERNRFYHRSTQYKNVTAAGARGMLYLSLAAMNERQVGSVSLSWESVGPIPAITIGADDGAAIRAALAANKTVHAVMDAEVSAVKATGSNWIGSIPGREAGQVVIGAHYDTWFVGSTDNSGGVAALLALAASRKAQGKPRYTLVFVAYDGEEVALYGGYDYLRRHRVETVDPILAVLNFEGPSARESNTFGLAHSALPLLDTAITSVGLEDLYNLYVGMEIVPELFGGIIPTDIQGIYRTNVPTISTAVDSPYYHTRRDTPDKVDVDFLAEAVYAFDLALGIMLDHPPSDFVQVDSKLWNATVVPRARAAGAPLQVDVTITDSVGAPQMMALVQGALLYDDFFQAGETAKLTDATGKVTLEFPAAQADMGAGRRFVHITSGPSWPLVEGIAKLP